MRNQMYPPPPPPCGKGSLTLRKHLLRLIFAAAVLFTLTACEPPGPPVTPSADKSFTTTVSGTVTEKGGSTALKDVTVCALAGKTVVKTGADGKYKLVVTHKGSFTLSISAAGYVGQSLPIKTKERTLTRNIALEKAVESTTVRGTVTAPDSTPLGGVRISVKDRPDVSPVTTGANGNYRNLVVPHSGSFTLTAAKNGYAEKTAALTTRNTSAVQNFTLTLVGTLAFESPQIRKSKMLVITNPNPAAPGTYIAQTYTNTLLYEGKAVTAGVLYSITEKPAGITNEITVNPGTGQVSFGKDLYDAMEPSISSSTSPVQLPARLSGPQTVTVQAAYQGKTANYTFTVTDHFSPREGYSSVVVGDDIYVMGGVIRRLLTSFSVGVPAVRAVQSNEVWRSSDGGITWDQVAKDGSRFTPRGNHASAVLGSGGSAELYVIGGAGGNGSATPLDDVWKSTDRGVTWVRVTPAGSSVQFPMDYNFTSAVLGNTLYVIGGIRSLPFLRLDQVWSSTDRGVSWRDVTPTNTALPPRFPARSAHTSVVPASGSGGAEELYVIGGSTGDKDDVWKSAGVTAAGGRTTWSNVPTPSGGRKFPGRSSHSSAVVGNDIYVISGFRGGIQRNDIWKSGDNGAAWSQVIVNPASSVFSARENHNSVVQGGALFVIGGRTGAITLFNDVWKSDNGGAGWVNVHKN